MDCLLKIKDEVEYATFDKLRTLFSVSVKLTFYDITSTYVYGDECPITDYGYSRDHRSDCEQIVIGIVTSYEGYPVKHYVFQGNTNDSTTVKEVIGDLKSQYNIQETIFVGDRGMITKLNLQDIENNGFSYIMGVKSRQDQICKMVFDKEQINWADAQNYNENLKMVEKHATVKEFLVWKSNQILQENKVSVSHETFTNLAEKIRSLTNGYQPAYKDFKTVLQNLSDGIDTKICKKIFGVIKNYKERYEKEFRFVFCLNPEIKQLSQQRRTDHIKEISDQLDSLLPGKNDKEQKKKKGTEKTIKKTFDGYKGKYRKFFNLLFDEKGTELVGYSKNEGKIQYEKRFDGVFVILSNKKYEDLDTRKIVESYKNLKEVEMIHDDLKNFVDVRPIRHWLEDRVRAHVFICVLALLLKRTFEINYLKSKATTKPLEEISKVKLVTYKIKFSKKEDRQKTLSKVTNLTSMQKKYFNMIGIKNPMNLKKFLWWKTKK
jgi:transposase